MRSGKFLKITVIKYGETDIHEKMAFQDGNPEIKIPIDLLFFLIETKDKKILVDAGCDTMPGFTLKKFKKPVDVLESSGVLRDKITDVLVTHAHHDHIDGVRYYKNARVILHKDEMVRAEKYLSENTKIVTFEDEYKITDDIKIKHIGGHSAGSSIVLVDTDAEKLVLCGDECYLRENLVKQMPTGSSVNVKKSTDFVNEYRKKCYRTILFHEPGLIDNIGSRRI